MIERNLQKAASQPYDLIVVGGGIYGSCLALESARRGLRPLLVERDDFGGATSWNSLRIVHGGLRYLQKLDIKRFFESVRERRWFLREFPELVDCLPCLMPLYGTGVRRNSVLRAALCANDVLSWRRNRGVPPERKLSRGTVLSAKETIERFPNVDRSGLTGGALWYDGVMRNSQRLLIEILRWACHCGATVLNYMEARELRLTNNRVEGLIARCRETNETYQFEAPLVINCAGPWCRSLAATFHRDFEALFRPSLAFNVLLDRPPLSSAALALAPKTAKSTTYFLHPWKGHILAGTVHAPWRGSSDFPQPTAEQVDALLADINQAVPELNLTSGDVLKIYTGLLPTTETATAHLAVREVILDHGRHGGPRGAWSVSGVKFTTARLVAEKLLRRLHAKPVSVRPLHAKINRPAPAQPAEFYSSDQWLQTDRDLAATALRQIVSEEAVLHLDDLLLRRLDWAVDLERQQRVGREICDLLGWSGPRCDAEMARLDECDPGLTLEGAVTAK